MPVTTDRPPVLAKKRSTCGFCKGQIIPGHFTLITQTVKYGWCHTNCAEQLEKAAAANQEYYRAHPGQQ